MANMSYCRFRNTLTDLQDCEDALHNDAALSDEEKRARDKLLKLCRRIAVDYPEEAE
jgi:hypothetical protein